MTTRISSRLKIIIILVFVGNYSNNIFSQSRSIYSNDAMIGKKSHSTSSFGFSVTSYVVNKAKTESITGSYHLTTAYKHGFEAGPDLYFYLKNNYALQIGLHAQSAATNYNLFILGSDFNPSLGGDVDDKGPTTSLWSFYICSPISIQKRWFTEGYSFWNIVAGISVRYNPGRFGRYGIEEIYRDVNGNQVTVLKIDAFISKELRACFNYDIGGGYSMLLRNNNYLQCNLIVNFSDKKIINGTYQINVTGKPLSTGTYSANLSYIGLSFSYIFTGANKRIRKMYEENLKSNR